MPIFMDVHIIPGVKAEDVAQAHRQDLLMQDQHQCKCMTYWIDETRESIFCLIEAPNKEAVVDLHAKAHGLVPNKVIEVNPYLVETFLGRIYDPSSAVTTENGLKIFADPSFRILLVTKTIDPVLLKQELGTDETNEIFQQHNAVIRKNILQHDGCEVEAGGAGFIISFSSASKALACAKAIQNELTDAKKIGMRMAINAGEPVDTGNKLFGDTIRFASQLCSIANANKIAVSAEVKELLSKDNLNNNKDLVSLAPQDEELLKNLFSKLEEHWCEAEFDVDDYAKAMAMSKSQLYRKCISLTGESPNQLLKDYRLERAKGLMKKQRFNIAQITFESGFTSPSYFTKCFKRKYGVLPLAYLELLR